jgi:hypothetical protein
MLIQLCAAVAPVLLFASCFVLKAGIDRLVCLLSVQCSHHSCFDLDDFLHWCLQGAPYASFMRAQSGRRQQAFQGCSHQSGPA